MTMVDRLGIRLRSCEGRGMRGATFAVLRREFDHLMDRGQNGVFDVSVEDELRRRRWLAWRRRRPQHASLSGLAARPAIAAWQWTVASTTCVGKRRSRSAVRMPD